MFDVLKSMVDVAASSYSYVRVRWVLVSFLCRREMMASDDGGIERVWAVMNTELMVVGDAARLLRGAPALVGPHAPTCPSNDVSDGPLEHF